MYQVFHLTRLLCPIAMSFTRSGIRSVGRAAVGRPPLYYNCTNTVDINDDESLWTAIQEVNHTKQNCVRIKETLLKDVTVICCFLKIFFWISYNFSWNSEPQLSKQKMFLWTAEVADPTIPAQHFLGMGVGRLLEKQTSWAKRGIHLYLYLFQFLLYLIF